MSYVEQFDVKHKRLNEPIKEGERAMEHTHISDTVKMVSVLHHFFIAPAAAAIFPFVLNSIPRTRSESFLSRNLYCYILAFTAGAMVNNAQWATPLEHGSWEKYFGVKKIILNMMCALCGG